jgi:nodulation protein E
MNALGHDVPTTLTAMQNGVCGIGPLEIRDVDRLTQRIAGQVRDYDETAYFNRQELALFDRFTQFALLAANQAVTQSGIEITQELSQHSGVVIGTSGGGLNTQDENYRQVYEEGKNRVHPFIVPKLMANAAASQIAMKWQLQGPSYTVSTACASSNHAMGQAFHMIRAGMAKAMVTGGAESMLCFGGLKAWEGLRVMSKTACRPFSATRDGMVQGEGAAVYVFEDYEHARQRGADILCEIKGFAMTSDASDIVMPSRAGAARAISGALQDAGISADKVGYINAHGTGTTANDATEASAIADVFGAHTETLMVSSTKAMHGHIIGGTGAVEMLACIMALRDGVIAPTIGFEAPDPACPLDVVPNQARAANVSVALSNAFAFGGLNAVLVLSAI